MKNNIVLGTMAAFLTMGAASAQAAQDDHPGWYGGLQINRNTLNGNGGQIGGALSNQNITTSGVSTGTTSTTLGGDVGFRFTKNFSVEGGYTSLGKRNYTAAATSPAADTIQGTAKASVWSMAGIGTLPLDDKWSLYAKGGLTRVSANLSATSATGATSPTSQSASRTGMVIGAGATYDFTSTLFAQMSWDRYNRVGTTATGTNTDNQLSAGIGVRF